jgi:Ser/Thr protein kinase RdoA (MazF antagonist)
MSPSVISDMVDLTRRMETQYDLNLSGRTMAIPRDRHRIGVCIDTTENSIFLKEKPYYLLNSEFAFHLELHDHAYKVGAPVVRLYKTRSGKLFGKWRGRCFELQEWIRGLQVSPERPADRQELGRLLAKLHRASMSFTGDYRGDWSFFRHRHPLFPDKQMRDWLSLLEYLRQAFQKLAIDHDKDVDDLRRLIARDVSEIESTIGLCELHVHGDLVYANTVKSDSGTVYALDLDDSRWGYRMTDLAWSSMNSLFSNTNSRVSEINPDKILAPLEVIEGYQEVLAISEAELELAPRFLELALIRGFVDLLDLDEPTAPPPNLGEQFGLFLKILLSIGPASASIM